MNIGAALFVALGGLAVLAVVSWWWRRRQRVVELDGRHVLITGGSEGLGLEFAKLCVRRGAHVTLVARREAKLKLAQAEVEQARKRSTQTVGYEVCDVTQAAQMEAAVAACSRVRGPVDLLVANAGMSVPKLFADLSEAELRQMVDVNLFGAANACRAVLPAMQAAHSGRVVFVASAMSLTAFAGFSGYCASKWGVRGMAECLESELRPAGIAVHIYYATTMETPGLTAENAVKPPVTHELEAMGESVTGAEAARMLWEGVERGQFSITADVGAELMAMGALLSPHHNLALRTLLAPLTAVVGAVWRWHIDRVTARSAAKRNE